MSIQLSCINEIKVSYWMTKLGSHSSANCRKIWKGGLQKVWIRYDIADHTRYFPIDFMYEHLGANFCSNPLNGDILAGYGMKR